MKTKNRLFSKRLIAIMLTAFMATTAAFAAQRSLEEMKSIAYAAFNLENTQTVPFQVPLLDVKCKSSDLLDASLFKNDEEVFYIFAFTNGAPGYVIVSADTRLPEVIAYSASSRFDGNKMPEPMKAFLQTYVEKMNNTPKNFVAKRRAPGRFFANAATLTSVEPLLGDIAFNQREPYNNACPVYNGERCVTGCVATAMAQVLKYYEYPTKMKGSNISYTTDENGIPVIWDPSSTTFDWTKIKDFYKDYIAPYTADETVVSTNLMSISGIDLSSYYYLYLQSFNNISGESLSFEANFILTDNSGNFIQPVSEGRRYSDLPGNAYFDYFYLYHPVLPFNLSDGNYRLYIGIKKDGTSEWSYAKNSNEDFYLNVSKTGNFFTIEGSDFIYPCGYNDEEADEVAKLHAACGAAVEMDYGTDASGAYNSSIAPALINYFSYDKGIETLSPLFFQTADEWHARIQQELQASRPLIVSGRAENNTGHSYIIDGYRYDGSEPYYHINWGWGGSDNAYFLIDNMRPSEAGTGGYTDNYSYRYSLLFGIQPENKILGDVDMSGEVNITDVVALVNYILSNDSSSVLSNGDMDGNGSIDITDVVALVNLILSN